MKEINEMHVKEMKRMYSSLSKLEPGTDEYDKLLSQIMKAEDRRLEVDKIESANCESENKNKEARKNRLIQIGTFSAGLLIPPIIDLICKRNLTKLIGTVEQMETFTTTPGRSISGWFR